MILCSCGRVIAARRVFGVPVVSSRNVRATRDAKSQGKRFMREDEPLEAYEPDEAAFEDSDSFSKPPWRVS